MRSSVGAGRRKVDPGARADSSDRGRLAGEGERGVVTPPPSRLGAGRHQASLQQEVSKVWAWACSWQDGTSLTL